MSAERSAEPVQQPDESRVLVIARVFDAPRDLVFQAFADPARAIKWGGPRDYPMVSMESDWRPGGKWRACLKSTADGSLLWQGGINREITPPERLSFTFAWDHAGELGPETLVTITFAEQGSKTLMTFRQEIFDSVGNRDGHRSGWTSAFDRLEEYLETH